VALPVLASTLTTAVVFFPVTLLYGVSRFLFSALAVAVVLALLASYVIALTVVPLFCSRYISKPHSEAGMTAGARFNRWFNARFEAFLGLYDRAVSATLDAPKRVLAGFALVFLAGFPLVPLIGVSFFPRTDAGQFVMNVKMPSGTRIGVTERGIERVEQLVRKVVKPEDLEVIVSNIGTTPGFSAVYSANSGMHSSFVQVALREGHRTGSYDYMRQVRQRLAEEMPHVTAFFQSGGLVDAVLNLGLPAPIDVQVAGTNLERSYKVATELAGKIRRLPGVAEVYIPQDLDYPALQVDIDRVRAAQMGLDQREIVHNMTTALTSNAMIAPTFWTDPKSGYDYMLTVQYREDQIRNLGDLLAIPIRGTGQKNPTRLDAVSTTRRIAAPTEVDHYQLRRVIDVLVGPEEEDLGAVASAIDKEVAGMQIPAGVTVTLRGMVQGMRSSFRSFAAGLLLAVLLLYLILVAQFRSFMDPFLILLAVPPGLLGVLFTLVVTGTTLNVMSLMGVVMLVGIAVSNSILIVEFTRRLREEGMKVRPAVSLACRVRLRPVLMTSLATIIGLIPMALKLGAGSEAYAPLARAIIGGLAMSVILTVFLVPAGYYLWYRRTEETADAK
jgi:multidrug efflux pump subunit AcrB